MIITYEMISQKPCCQSPSNWIATDWSGTLLDLYNLENLDLDGKVLMGVFFLSNDELITFAQYCVAQALGLSGDSELFLESQNKSQTALNLSHPWLISWYAASNAAKAGANSSNSSENIIREDQVNYLKLLEQNRE